MNPPSTPIKIPGAECESKSSAKKPRTPSQEKREAEGEILSKSPSKREAPAEANLSSPKSPKTSTGESLKKVSSPKPFSL